MDFHTHHQVTIQSHCPEVLITNATTAQPRSFRRVNGCSWPPHPFQFGAWGILIYFTFIHFSTVSPQFVIEWQPASYALVAILLVIHFLTHLLCTLIDPADDNVRHKGKKQKLPDFDRSQHKHVIENQHCYICEVKVSRKSKHCSACNKCIVDFDHHCKWLNNCVGSRNYRIFIAMLSSGVVGLLLIAVFSVVQFVAYFTDKSTGSILQPYREILPSESQTTSHIYFTDIVTKADNNSTSTSVVTETTQTTSQTTILTTEGFSLNVTDHISTNPNFFMSTMSSSHSVAAVFRICTMPVPDVAWQVVIMLTIVLATISICLLAHLLFFHLDLICRGMSTYDYITEQRELEVKAEKGENGDSVSPIPASKNHYKANQVAPDQKKPAVNVVHVESGDILGPPSKHIMTNGKPSLQNTSNSAGGRFHQAAVEQPTDHGDGYSYDKEHDGHQLDELPSRQLPDCNGLNSTNSKRHQRPDDLYQSRSNQAGETKNHRKKYKQKPNSRPDYESATPTDIGLQSVFFSGSSGGGVVFNGASSGVYPTVLIPNVTDSSALLSPGYISVPAVIRIPALPAGDGTTGRSEESLGAHGDSELYESDSGVGSETPGAFGQTNKVKLSAPKLKRKHARASLVADKLNNSESKETVTPNGDASVVVNAKLKQTNGQTSYKSNFKEVKPFNDQQQKLRLGHQMVLPGDDTDSEDEDKEKNSDSTNVGMVWSPQAFPSNGDIVYNNKAYSTGIGEQSSSNSDSDESLREIPLSHIKTHRAQHHADLSYTKPKKKSKPPRIGRKQLDDASHKHSMDDGRSNSAFNDIDESDNSLSQTYEIVPSVSKLRTDGKSSKGSSDQNKKNSFSDDKNDKVQPAASGDITNTSIYSKRPPSGNFRPAHQTDSRSKKREDKSTRQQDVPSVDISSFTTSSEDRKLKEYIEKSLIDDMHMGV